MAGKDGQLKATRIGRSISRRLLRHEQFDLDAGVAQIEPQTLDTPLEFDEIRYVVAGAYKVGPYRVRLALDEFDGRLEVVGLDIRALPTRSGLPPRVSTSGTLRRIPLSWMIADLVDFAAKNNVILAEVSEEMEDRVSASPAAIARAAGRTRTRKGPGRPPTSREELAEVAARYNEAWRAGSRSPTKDIWQKYYPDWSRSSVAHWVSLCRDPEYKLLPKTQPRVAKGKRTTKKKGRKDA